MFDTPVKVPDQISTLELSQLWLYKAFQELQQELEAENEQESPESSSEEADQ